MPNCIECKREIPESEFKIFKEYCGVCAFKLKKVEREEAIKAIFNRKCNLYTYLHLMKEDSLFYRYPFEPENEDIREVALNKDMDMIIEYYFEAERAEMDDLYPYDLAYPSFLLIEAPREYLDLILKLISRRAEDDQVILLSFLISLSNLGINFSNVYKSKYQFVDYRKSLHNVIQAKSMHAWRPDEAVGTWDEEVLIEKLDFLEESLLKERSELLERIYNEGWEDDIFDDTLEFFDKLKNFSA